LLACPARTKSITLLYVGYLRLYRCSSNIYCTTGNLCQNRHLSSSPTGLLFGFEEAAMNFELLNTLYSEWLDYLLHANTSARRPAHRASMVPPMLRLAVFSISSHWLSSISVPKPMDHDIYFTATHLLYSNPHRRANRRMPFCCSRSSITNTSDLLGTYSRSLAPQSR
jgi:hypothetical protein